MGWNIVDVESFITARAAKEHQLNIKMNCYTLIAGPEKPKPIWYYEHIK